MLTKWWGVRFHAITFHAGIDFCNAGFWQERLEMVACRRPAGAHLELSGLLMLLS
jgi:hypothetical protein